MLDIVNRIRIKDINAESSADNDSHSKGCHDKQECIDSSGGGGWMRSGVAVNLDVRTRATLKSPFHVEMLQSVSEESNCAVPISALGNNCGRVCTSQPALTDQLSFG